MASVNSISVEKLARLIGTPNCPALIDVRTEADFQSAPQLIPGSVRRSYTEVVEWATELTGKSAVVVCGDGHKQSPGVSAWLRHRGIPADALDGGLEEWARA